MLPNAYHHWQFPALCRALACGDTGNSLPVTVPAPVRIHPQLNRNHILVFTNMVELLFNKAVSLHNGARDLDDSNFFAGLRGLANGISLGGHRAD